MPYFVDAQPGLLQQIIRVDAAGELHQEKPVELRAQSVDQRSGRREIALLIADHQLFQLAVNVHSVKRPRAVPTSIGVAPRPVYQHSDTTGTHPRRRSVL